MRERVKNDGKTVWESEIDGKYRERYSLQEGRKLKASNKL